MVYWIIDTTTQNVISGGLKQEEVNTFIDYNKAFRPLKNLAVRCDLA